MEQKVVLDKPRGNMMSGNGTDKGEIISTACNDAPTNLNIVFGH